MRTWITIPLLIWLAACAAPETAPPPSEPAGPAADELVREAMRTWLNAQIRGDEEALAPLYAEGAILLVPGRPALSGREAVLTEFRRLLAEAEIQLTYTSDERQIREDLSVERGRLVRALRPRAGGQARAESLNLLTVMTREADGTWRIAWQMWNSNLPAVPAASGQSNSP